MIRILLADGQELAREGLRILLDAEPDLCVVATADTGDAALVAAATAQPDIALLDRDLPGADGLATTRLLAAHCPHLAILLVATFPDPIDAARAHQAGACAYLPKGQESDALTAAIRAAARAVAPHDQA